VRVVIVSTTVVVPDEYPGTDKLILGIVLAVIIFWPFAQTTLNVTLKMRNELQVLTALPTLWSQWR